MQLCWEAYFYQKYFLKKSYCPYFFLNGSLYKITLLLYYYSIILSIIQKFTYQEIPKFTSGLIKLSENKEEKIDQTIFIIFVHKANVVTTLTVC